MYSFEWHGCGRCKSSSEAKQPAKKGVRRGVMGLANRARTTEMGCAEGADCGFVRKAYSFYIMTMIDENFT